MDSREGIYKVAGGGLRVCVCLCLCACACVDSMLIQQS